MQTKFPELRAWRTPRCFEGRTVVCIGGGPSLTIDQVALCAGLPKVGVNDAYRIADLDVLYACDYEWWKAHAGVPSFGGPKVTLSDRAAHEFGLHWLRETGQMGYDPDPTALRTGENGGYQALHLAAHMGATRILLLGYDMQPAPGRSHWFGDHPGKMNKRSPYRSFQFHFGTIVAPLHELGVEVINCSPGSALKAFSCMSIEQALERAAA